MRCLAARSGRWYTAAMQQLAAVFLVGAALAVAVQEPPANYDEQRVPAYVLPDPLIKADGTRVTSAHQWQAIRRPEVLRLFATEVYGRTPREPGADGCGPG